MIDRVFLVGFMGSGKSEVGQLLAERLDWAFLDLDKHISSEAGCSIPEIFEREGEAGFRERERQALLESLSLKHTVISCGGGIVTQPENLINLKEQPGTYCLQVSEEEIWKRVGQDPNRPLLKGDDPRKRIQDLLTVRAPLYAEIPRQVKTDGFRPSEVADHILSELRKGLPQSH